MLQENNDYGRTAFSVRSTSTSDGHVRDRYDFLDTVSVMRCYVFECNLLFEVEAKHNFMLLNEPHVTTWSRLSNGNCQESVLDLTFASAALTRTPPHWEVLNDLEGSDHRALLTTFHLQARRQRLRPQETLPRCAHPVQWNFENPRNEDAFIRTVSDQLEDLRVNRLQSEPTDNQSNPFSRHRRFEDRATPPPSHGGHRLTHESRDDDQKYIIKNRAAAVNAESVLSNTTLSHCVSTA